MTLHVSYFMLSCMNWDTFSVHKNWHTQTASLSELDWHILLYTVDFNWTSSVPWDKICCQVALNWFELRWIKLWIICWNQLTNNRLDMLLQKPQESSHVGLTCGTRLAGFLQGCFMCELIVLQSWGWDDTTMLAAVFNDDIVSSCKIILQIVEWLISNSLQISFLSPQSHMHWESCVLIASV